jgi:hypothetical protein
MSRQLHGMARRYREFESDNRRAGHVSGGHPRGHMARAKRPTQSDLRTQVRMTENLPTDDGNRVMSDLESLTNIETPSSNIESPFSR